MATQIPSLIGRTMASGANAGTTPSLDTTGATLLVVLCVNTAASAAPVITDSQSNTWTSLTAQSVSGNQRSFLAYVANPTVGIGHTFTLTGSGSSPLILASAWSGIVAASPFDQQNGNAAAGSATTIQAGSITPGSNGELLIAACVTGAGIATTGNVQIDYQVSSIYNGGCSWVAVVGSSWGAYLAFGNQVTAAATNPTWTLVQGTGTNSNMTSHIASFKAATAASGGGTTGFASA